MELNNFQTIVIAGPTASGKTKLSIDLASQLGGEIINADSMQVYKGLEKLRALPSLDDFNIVKHHLFGIIDQKIKYSVGKWLEEARPIINDIHQRRKIAFIVGGSGMYLNACLKGFSNIPQISLKTKAHIKELFEKYGLEYLFNEYCKLAPSHSKKLKPKDTYRIIRAYEVFEDTGRSLDWWHNQPKLKPLISQSFKILLLPSKDLLYPLIEKRLEKMIKAGALEEIKNEIKSNLTSELPSMKALGFKQFALFIEGKSTYSEALSLSKRDSRRYAKRQITWFRNSFKSDKILENIYIGQKFL